MQVNEMLARLKELDMPVFANRDISGLADKNPKYTKVFLYNLVKRGRIERVERGKYCLPDTSPYVIASRMTKGSYIALISAARFHNITTQLPNTILVFSPTYHRPMSIKSNYRVRFIKVSRKILYGYSEHNGVYGSDIEKIFVDDVYYHKSLSYTEELENAAARHLIDLHKLDSYIKRLDRKDIEERLRRSIGEIGIE